MKIVSADHRSTKFFFSPQVLQICLILEQLATATCLEDIREIAYIASGRADISSTGLRHSAGARSPTSLTGRKDEGQCSRSKRQGDRTPYKYR